MKITNVSFERLKLSLSEPYKIAYETITSTVNFILKIETDSPFTGYGCAAPDAIVTGENPDQVEEAIKNFVVPILIGENPYNYARLIDKLKKSNPGYSSTLAMVDMALYDLVSKKAGMPLYQFLGGFRDSIPTSITIGILPLDETLRRAAEFVAQGFTILKVKGGDHLDEDVEKMVMLREKFPYVVFRFDGNQGYSVEESVSFVKNTMDVGIEIFEQPVKTMSGVKLGDVTNRVSIPVMADESLKSLSDAFRLAQNEHVDMVNIKLMKVGGILEGKHINSVAKSAGLESMVGCIDECSLGIAAGLHFALSRPNIHYADLDGHLDLVNDPFKNLFRLDKGVLYPNQAHGLGKIEL